MILGLVLQPTGWAWSSWARRGRRKIQGDPHHIDGGMSKGHMTQTKYFHWLKLENFEQNNNKKKPNINNNKRHKVALNYMSKCKININDSIFI